MIISRMPQNPLKTLISIISDEWRTRGNSEISNGFVNDRRGLMQLPSGVVQSFCTKFSTNDSCELL
jgi:hypothetical protein